MIWVQVIGLLLAGAWLGAIGTMFLLARALETGEIELRDVGP